MKTVLALLLAVTGAHWHLVPVPTTASFRGLSAIDEDIVWVSGTNGTVIRTTDSGKTWGVLPVPGAEDLDFRGIHAFSATTALIMSSGPAEKGQARVYRTADAGHHWAMVLEEKTSGAFFDAIAFWDAHHGILVGDPVDGRFMLFTTEDGGATWQRVPPAKLPPALEKEGAFAASNSCLAVEGSGNAWFATGGASVARVFRSKDRGKTWSVANTPAEPRNASTGIFSIAFRDGKHGVAVGGDYQQPDAAFPNPLVTSDGGQTWRTAGPVEAKGYFLSAVAFMPNAEGLPSYVRAAGPGGDYLVRDNGQLASEGDVNLNAIAFPVPIIGWAVGPKGTIARWNIDGPAGVYPHRRTF